MPEAVHVLRDISAVPGTDPGGEADSVKELDFDLSRHAVPISGIFGGAASAEELQLVRRLFFLPGSDAPRVAVFCSVGPRNRAEYVCARAAEILASQTKDAVCIVDANLKDPKLHQRHYLDTVYHETNLGPLRERNPREHKGGEGLWVLPASALRESCPALPPDRLRDRLSRLRKRFGYLLVCAPTLDSAGDGGLLLGQMSDGIVLILEPHSTQRAAVVKARQLLEAYNIRLLGAVLIQGSAKNF